MEAEDGAGKDKSPSTLPLAQLAIFEAAMTLYGRDFPEVQKCVPWMDTKGVVGYYYKQFKRSKNYERWAKQHKLKQYAAEELSAEAALNGVEKPWLSDFWDEICGRCREMGNLVCCDTCNLAWHEDCLVASERPQEHQQAEIVPGSDDISTLDVSTLWSCPDCSKSGEVSTDEGKRRQAAWVRKESAGISTGANAATHANVGVATSRKRNRAGTKSSSTLQSLKCKEESKEEGEIAGKKGDEDRRENGKGNVKIKGKDNGSVLGGRRRVEALWSELWPMLQEAGWRCR
jgi:hypothetical protein